MLAFKHEDGRTFVAIGFNPMSGDLLFVPEDTDIIEAVPPGFAPDEEEEKPVPYPGQLIIPGMEA